MAQLWERLGYDAANRKTSEDQTVTGYPSHHLDFPLDNDGNRTEITMAGGLYTVYYDYTQRNQLAHIIGGGPITWFTYTYDAAGNMTKLQDNFWSINDSINAPSQYYDALNRPTMWENTLAGNTITQSNYGNRFMFQGREYLTTFGIYDYRHRFYEPQLGRFIEQDPTGFAAGDNNLFRYCADDPVNRTDPMGLEGEDYTLDEAMRAGRALVRKEAFGQKATYDPVAKQMITHGKLVPVLRNGRGGYELGKPVTGEVELAQKNSQYKRYEEHEKIPSALMPRLVGAPHSHQDRTGVGHPAWSDPDYDLASKGKIVERVDEKHPGNWHHLERTNRGYKDYDVNDNGKRVQPGSNGTSNTGSGPDTAPDARTVDLAHQATGVPSLGAEAINFAPGRP